jgi:phosphohistidine phosphatase
MTMRLMLLRHAKSDWSRPGVADHERPLNARGRKAAPKIGATIARHDLVPDLIVASTATRVRETLDLVLAAFKRAPKVTHDARVYEAEPDALMQVIRETPREMKSLLLVGHNPGLAELAALLIASGKAEARTRMAAKFPTAALAVIDFTGSDWSRLRPRSGRLDRFIVPKGLKGETD